MRRDETAAIVILVIFIIVFVLPGGRSGDASDEIRDAYIEGAQDMYNSFERLDDGDLFDYVSTVYCYFAGEDVTLEEASEAFEHIDQFYKDYKEIEEP